MPGIARVALLGAAALTSTVFATGAVLIVVSRVTCRRIRRITATNRPH